jgi:glycosyltransferase involved in cell wall biosynthesis
MFKHPAGPGSISLPARRATLSAGKRKLLAGGLAEDRGYNASGMRVLAINQFYLPDFSATAQLLGELCEDLSAAGNDVEVIASQGAYLGGQQRLGRVETLRGVGVRRVWATSLGKRTIARRATDYGTFWASANAAALLGPKPDVILALTTPPTIALGLANVARLRSIPLVTWNQDVYPETAAALGVLSPSGLSYRALLATASMTHRLAARIVALSDEMAERLVAQGAPRSKLRVIPNWADGRPIRPRPRAGNPFRQKHGLEGKFVVMYSGNIGAGHDVETLVQAAHLLAPTSPEVMFVFIGDGVRRRQAEELARRASNVRFLPYQRKEELGTSLSGADVHLVSLREGLEGLLVPSKVYGILASGRPVCYIGPPACEAAKIVRGDDLGWEGRNGDARGLARAVWELAGDEVRWRGICERARIVFETRYDRPICVARWSETLHEALSTKETRGAE